ncbi:MAG: helix-turn-helix domain-containing protein, partial [Candidatus Bilamarchaeaceae archaeon]
MAVYGSIIPRSRCLAKIPSLSRTARLRLRWIDYYNSHGSNASLTCRHFGISRQTFYRWKRRYEQEGLKALEDRSRRPKKVRRPSWSFELEQEVKQLREQYPRWGKDKLARLEPLKGKVSVSMVGRILRHLKATGRLKEPMLRAVSARKRRKRRYAIRMPKDYVVKDPGDMVQVDVKYVGIVPGVRVKHFTAKDAVSKWGVTEVHGRATSKAAAKFLDAVEGRMPFKVKAIQVDGGSAFCGEFELECQKRGIMLIVLPPRSPKL